MRILPLILVFPLLTTFAPFSLAREPVTPAVLHLFAEPVALAPAQPDRSRVGSLRFLQGWWLRSNDPKFGGVSAMQVADGGVTALTDAGRIYEFTLPQRAGRLPVKGRWLDGGSGMRKEARDTEAMARAGGRTWVSYERQNMVARYRGPNWQLEASARPPSMRRWPLNAGAEAMLRLPDGRFLIFCEGRRTEGGVTPVVLFQGDPAAPGTKAQALGYRAPDGYRITDAAALPDGRLLFLNRRVSLLDGIQVKVTLADQPVLGAGTVIAGREIAHFGQDVTTDNYEALSITREGGRTIVWIASDDNFIAFQRTLLMKFALDG